MNFPPKMTPQMLALTKIAQPSRGGANFTKAHLFFITRWFAPAMCGPIWSLMDVISGVFFTHLYILGLFGLVSGLLAEPTQKTLLYLVEDFLDRFLFQVVINLNVLPHTF